MGEMGRGKGGEGRGGGREGTWTALKGSFLSSDMSYRSWLFLASLAKHLSPVYDSNIS